MTSLYGASFASVQVLEVLCEFTDFHRWIYFSILYEFEVRRWSGIRVRRTHTAYTTGCFVIPVNVSLSVCFVLFSSISICTQFLHDGSTGNSSAVILCIAESKLTFQFRLHHRHTSVTGCDWTGLP